VRRFLDGPYKDTNVTAKLDAWSAQIQDAVSEAASAGHTPTASAWQSEVSTLKTAIADLRTAAEARAQ
jgi:hypothetical protein